MSDLLILISVLAWAGVVFTVTNITTGLGFAAFAVWWVVLARMVQANKHHKELLAALRDIRPN